MAALIIYFHSRIYIPLEAFFYLPLLMYRNLIDRIASKLEEVAIILLKQVVELLTLLEKG